VLAPPDDLPDAVLASALGHSWAIAVASVRYRAEGWGSHHWDVADAAGSRWFVTADDLAEKRLWEDGPAAAQFGRLRAALTAAADLRDCGRTFVVAPVPARDGAPLTLVSGRFAVAVYPFVSGQSFTWGEFSSPEHRPGVLALLAAVHTAPAAASRRALADDFAVPHRAGLEAALGPARETAGCGPPAGSGPYARPAALLLRQNAAPVRRLLARYDDLVRQAGSRPGRAVLTHGEPHAGNTMLTARGWVLVDWDTALVAPRERDLWHLDRGDPADFEAYADATGVSPIPSLMDLYRIRWDIADIASYASEFRRPHAGTANDDNAWRLLNSLIERVSGPDGRGRTDG
jgi:spectinomycin phosphotransferase/16S rRNA (guanine(1405)-N(7))-methyltransferase